MDKFPIPEEDTHITGKDIVRAFTESGTTDKEIVGFESTYEDGFENGIEFTLAGSSKYVGEDEMEFIDLKLAIDKHGWHLTTDRWVG